MAIDSRLEQIDSGWSDPTLKSVLLDRWTQNHNVKSIASATTFKNPEDLFDIALCISRPKLASIMERYAKDYVNVRSGLPDLFMWNVDERQVGDANGRFELGLIFDSVQVRGSQGGEGQAVDEAEALAGLFETRRLRHRSL